MWYYKNPNNPPEEQAFAAAYEKKYGKPAADKAWMGWITARSVFESIDAVKSTDPMAIVEDRRRGRGICINVGRHAGGIGIVRILPQLTNCRWYVCNLLATKVIDHRALRGRAGNACGARAAVAGRVLSQ